MNRPWLIDTSALLRLAESSQQEEWARRIGRGLVRITTVTLLEVGYSARSSQDLADAFHRPPVSSMPVEFLTPAAEARAVEVLEQLAARGHHRAPSIPDLLIAAAAEQARLTVLHVDKDFELIADLTGQEIERLSLGAP